jgi:CheY-like chemotaxis protein
MPSEPTTLPILIVEDDPATQSLLRVVLQRFGYASDVAGNGQDAIRQLQRKPYAAVVLDIMMPVSGGGDVLEFLTSLENPVPVVVCSAAGPAALTGFDTDLVKAVVRKPFEIEHLIAVIAGVAGTPAV